MSNQNKKRVALGDKNMEFDFERSRYALACKLVNVRTDMQYLSKAAFEPAFADMAVTACILTRNARKEEGYVPVTRTMTEQWGLQTDQLLDYAKRNMFRILPPKIYSMKDVMLSDQEGSVFHKVETMLSKRYPGTDAVSLKKAAMHIASQLCEKYEKHSGMAQMWVMSNKDWIFGASGLMNSRALQTFALKHECSFYILPSSIHEVILLPEKYVTSTDKLRDMLAFANTTAIEKKRFLSDCVYYYDMEKLEIRCL